MYLSLGVGLKNYDESLGILPRGGAIPGFFHRGEEAHSPSPGKQRITAEEIRSRKFEKEVSEPRLFKGVVLTILFCEASLAMPTLTAKTQEGRVNCVFSSPQEMVRPPNNNTLTLKEGLPRSGGS